ncbi:hypothetical protein PsorP6_014255 [Peronosclerospora sorghi]|uniref:Uncharacterized protein n=1 Tax=Peronosclerospora sorghi TaxID=230839 RepID=A0ACC0VJZ6_9STRA|nr:hypothetical protein PsorP6_014255 [Peronosclerospora sorghi]
MEKYHILERIGDGAFGKVYRGRRKYSGHIVALKFVTKHGKSARELATLRQEVGLQSIYRSNNRLMLSFLLSRVRTQIQLLRQLNHGNIIAILDAFDTEGEVCIVTEYAQGELCQVLKDEHTVPERAIRTIATQLVHALRVLHAHRIIHRDLKPQNILIGAREQLKLCDFGFARALEHDSSCFLRSIKGTPLYMAPELVQEKPYTHTVDLWSLGVILYELAVGKPPFYTDKIVPLIHMIVRDEIVYPSTMSRELQSFLSGLLTKDPAKRLQWPEILEHPFVKAQAEDVAKRRPQERPLRALPRFFSDTGGPTVSTSEKRENVKPSGERLRSCDEWKLCDPETERQLSLSNRNDTKEKALSLQADENNNQWAPPLSLKMPIETEHFVGLWKRIRSEINETNRVDAALLTSPLVTDAVALLPSILKEEVRVPNDILATIEALLHLLYRSMVHLLETMDQRVDFRHFLETKDRLHHFLITLVHISDTRHVNRENASDLIYKSVRCCMVCTTMVNQVDMAFETTFDYRESCRNDVNRIMLLLTRNDARFGSVRSKALQWLGSMMDRSQKVMTVLDIVSTSGLIPILCDIVASSASAASPVQRTARHDEKLRLYAIFALAALVQPNAKGWELFQSFPVMSLVRNASVPRTRPSSVREVKHQYKLRTKIHAELASQLAQRGVKELITLLGDEMTERVHDACSNSHDRHDDEDTEADLSTLGCILLIFLHACRASSSFSTKLTRTKVLFQHDCPTDVLTILVWGVPSKGLDRREQYVAIELVSAIVRRGMVSNSELWSAVRTFYPFLLSATDVALVSALSTFFAEVMERCNIDEFALDTSHSNGAVDSLDMEVVNLVAHGALTRRCANAIFRLFSPKQTEDVESDRPSTNAPMVTSYNVRAQGLLDSGIVFLLRVASKASVQPAAPCQNEPEPRGTQSNASTMFLTAFESASVWKRFDDMMATGGRDRLSPWGLFCFLKLLRIVREMQLDCKPIEGGLNDHLLSHLVNLLELEHIQSLFSWPEIVGGGSHAVKALVHATVKVVGLPFAYSVSDDLLADTKGILYNAQCVPKLLAVLRFIVSTKELQFGSSVLDLSVSFLSRLITSSSQFGSQFVAANGACIVHECGMLRRSGSPSLVIDTLSILIQVTRSSETNCHCLGAANLFPAFSNLLEHPDALVRANTLHCLGNFCRHSTRFYPQFTKRFEGPAAPGSVMDGTIRGLSDSDPSVRRWACFAIGNAAFHSGELYEALRPALAGLLVNLHDDEETTRSNAGGAVGNLVRHADTLCSDLCTYQAPIQLFESAVAEQSVAARRILLVALGNVCVYRQCFQVLRDARPTFVHDLARLDDKGDMDDVARRNIRRITANLEAVRVSVRI